MDALTLLLIVDMCNREHDVDYRVEKPAMYQPYKDSYPPLVTPSMTEADRECYSFRKPSWTRI